jgi:hypothetical protein
VSWVLAFRAFQRNSCPEVRYPWCRMWHSPAAKLLTSYLSLTSTLQCLVLDRDSSRLDFLVGGLLGRISSNTRSISSLATQIPQRPNNFIIYPPKFSDIALRSNLNSTSPKIFDTPHLVTIHRCTIVP